MRDAFALDPDITFLNHGSFGACPRAVLQAQAALRDRLEAEPVRFFLRECPALLEAARAELAHFLGARPQDLAFVSNATSGVNTVLRSLGFAPGDEVVVTRHGYAACNNAVRYAAERSGATVVVAEVPWPLPSEALLLERLTSAVTPRTRLVVVDHITSPSGLVWPVDALVEELEPRGVMVLVDGAHAPGQVMVDLTELDASFYTGNLHKWVCAPKGAAFLHVREDRQKLIHPLTISHGHHGPLPEGRSRFLHEFDWTGTQDPTPFLAVPAALKAVDALHPLGWPGVMAANRALAVQARGLLLEALGTTAPAPESMVGAMAAVLLPGRPSLLDGRDTLQEVLFHEHRIEVPVYELEGRRTLRVSAQRYNTEEEYRRLGAILRELFLED